MSVPNASAPRTADDASQAQHFTLHVLSDSLGTTADTFSRIMVSRFPTMRFFIERSPLINSPEMLRAIVESGRDRDNYLFVYTFARRDLIDAMAQCCDEGCFAVDLLSPAVRRIQQISGEIPTGKVGAIHSTDEAYYRRIDAIDYSIEHDDGRHPETLHEADIVLIGVSRSSKTPLSIYLAYRGWKVANIPLDPETAPPRELFKLDSRRIFGLVSTPEVLMEVRGARTLAMGTYVANYTSRTAVEHELKEARALMRRLGCIVINTAHRAIEEVAQDILRQIVILEGRSSGDMF